MNFKKFCNIFESYITLIVYWLFITYVSTYVSFQKKKIHFKAMPLMKQKVSTEYELFHFPYSDPFICLIQYFQLWSVSKGLLIIVKLWGLHHTALVELFGQFPKYILIQSSIIKINEAI